MEEIVINEVTAEEIYNGLRKYFPKDRVAFKLKDDCRYLGAFTANGKLVGCVGWQIIGTSLRYKVDFVLPEYRGKHIYSYLCERRNLIEQTWNGRITAFCTEMSLPMYLKMGFEAVSVNNNNITFVEKRK